MPGRTPAIIELRTERIALLFDSLDPFPIPSRDLAKTAEEFIVGWARELPRAAPIRILIHVPADEARREDAAGVATALGGYFTERAERMSWDMHELFRTGRLAWLIGFCALAVCILLSMAATTWFGESYLGRYFSEGIIIIGWVANWRPLEILLYDWWPITRRRRLFQRLAAAQVEVRPVAARGANEAVTSPGSN
jgi:hypothetical protein